VKEKEEEEVEEKEEEEQEVRFSVAYFDIADIFRLTAYTECRGMFRTVHRFFFNFRVEGYGNVAISGIQVGESIYCTTHYHQLLLASTPPPSSAADAVMSASQHHVMESCMHSAVSSQAPTHRRARKRRPQTAADSRTLGQLNRERNFAETYNK